MRFAKQQKITHSNSSKQASTSNNTTANGFVMWVKNYRERVALEIEKADKLNASYGDRQKV